MSLAVHLHTPACLHKAPVEATNELCMQIIQTMSEAHSVRADKCTQKWINGQKRIQRTPPTVEKKCICELKSHQGTLKTPHIDAGRFTN